MRFIKVLKSREGQAIDFGEIEPKVKDLSERFNILILYVFGSYASNNANALSDLDVAFLAENKFNVDKILSLIGELQDIFEEEAIDLVDLSQVPLTLIHRVFKGRCLYARDLRTKIEFESRKENLYYDTEHLRKEYFDALKRRIKDGTYGYR
ncbi:MAG: nucleotidyltransferase domain-containing protein [Deltaproteobacteria bacterium]|jgi:predicted nucleotidyltransferase|nr:nucleotidyltransferase domain-containing protein [Deltaproteobacteria bacterium]